MSDPQPATPAAADWEGFYSNYRKPGYVPGYELTTKLGGGQFGIVYRAKKQSIGKDYAIKFLQVDDGEVRRAIVAELEQLKYFAQIDHPNLVSIEDRGEVDGIPFLVMSFAGTQTLRDRMPGDGKVPTVAERDEMLQLFLQACRGVAALHDRSLVHFDLKPANVFLKGNVARVGDYGLSKLVTHSRGSLSMGRGTPYYMAPELLQRRGDARSDIYSLGVILYEIVCGKPPFTGDSEWEVLRKHETEPLQIPAHVRHRERGVLVRCLAKDPAERFQNVGELLAAFGAPTGAGAAAWSEVTRGAAVDSSSTPPLRPLPESAPQPPPLPSNPYSGFARASRDAMGHARTIAKEASQKARELAKKTRADARAAWRELSDKKAPKTARRIAAWQRSRGIRRARRSRERAERRANNGRALRTAFSFLLVTFALAFGGFFLFALLAPTSVSVSVSAPSAPQSWAVADASQYATLSQGPAPTQPMFHVAAVPPSIEAAVSKQKPEWLMWVDVDRQAAAAGLRAQLALIDAAGQRAQKGLAVIAPSIVVQLQRSAEELSEMHRLLETLAAGVEWDGAVAQSLQQFAPESLAMAAQELAAVNGAKDLQRAERLAQFLEESTGHDNLRLQVKAGLSPSKKVAASAVFGRLWLWYLNEAAWSKQAWDASRQLR